MSHGQHSSRYGTQSEQYVLENIYTFFSHIVVTLHDLRNPTPEMVSRFYGSFLEEMGVNITNLLQIQNNQMPLIMHVDMFNMSVPLLNQHQCLSFFLKHIGIAIEFTVSDLVSPTPKRTLQFFEGILRFLEYCDERIGSIQPALMEIREMGSRKNKLKEKIEVLRNNLNQHASNRVTRREKLKKVMTDVELEKERLDAIMGEKEKQVVTQNLIKKLLEEDAVKEDQLIQNLAQVGDDVNSLREMVVKSPERVKHSLSEIIQRRNDLQESVVNLKGQLEGKKHFYLLFSHEKVKQEERIEKLEEFLTIDADIKEEKQKISELKKTYVKLLECCNETKEQISSKEERQKILRSTAKEISNSRKAQYKMDKDLLDRARMELQDLLKRQEERIERRDQLQREIEKTDGDIEQLQAQFLSYEEKKNAVSAKHLSMKKSIAEKYSSLMSKLKQINENLKMN